MNKPILCLDFDGVIHSYISGWRGADAVPDPPVPGAINFLRHAVAHFRVCIYSTRSETEEGREAMRLAIFRWGIEDVPETVDYDPTWATRLEFPETKPPALVTLDDRAITFDGTWPDLETLRAFKPWNKR